MIDLRAIRARHERWQHATRFGSPGQAQQDIAALLSNIDATGSPLPALTIERLAALLHEASVGCYDDDDCLGLAHAFKPSGTVHTFDARSLLEAIAAAYAEDAGVEK